MIIRTLQADLLAGIIAKWRKVYPKASFSILTHADTQNLEYYATEFETVFPYQAKRDFSLFFLGPSLIRQIREAKFDMVIFPKKMNRLEGFENVILMLSALGIKQWSHCGIDGELLPIEKSYITKIVIAGLGSLIIAPLFYSFFIAALGIVTLVQKFGKQSG